MGTWYTVMLVRLRCSVQHSTVPPSVCRRQSCTRPLSLLNTTTHPTAVTVSPPALQGSALIMLSCRPG